MELLGVGRLVACVASACRVFETDAIDDLHLAAIVGDERLSLKRSRRFGHADAPDSEHVGHEFLRDYEFVRLGSILRHQQPPRQALFDPVKAQAGGGARMLSEEDVDVAVSR